MPSTFTHLHLHTQYSLLDGAILIDKLIPRIKELGMDSVAITDHGVMYGVVDFYNVCKKQGVKPIIGCEFYISPTDRFERNYVQRQTSNYHLILLAENNTGFANLRKLATIAQLEGFYRKPRIDKEVLEQYHEGIICLSACLGGEISQKILEEDYQSARDTALEYERIMGKGNYFLELQQNGIPEQALVNAQLINISEETGIPLIATCDCHYLNKGDHDSHEVLMCIQMGSHIGGGGHMETASEELYVKSPQEIAESFAATPEAVANTQRVADRCNVTMEFDKTYLPHYDVPEGYTAETYLKHVADEGLKRHLARIAAEKHQIYYDRLEMEMNVIKQKGYVGYFLIVWDFINYARTNGISVGPGRGSGAGSLVAYSLGITNIDPIYFNLLFERFLNPERPSMPDFDIDFCVVRRDEVIQYVREKYGEDRVSQIATFGRLAGRGLIRDVCRVLMIPLDIADKYAKLIPETPGMTISKAVKDDASIKQAYESTPEGVEMLKHALNLEGLLRQSGMHAAGVVIADQPLTEYVPLARGKDGEAIAQYEKGLIEKIGLVKFDFLGLANLTIIDAAVKRIHKIDPNFDITLIPYDEAGVYEMLARGESTGVFQLESDGMRRLMKKLGPTVLEDLIAVNALYRPGPINGGMLDIFCDRKNGIQQITYALPELENILKETYGIIVYQEQVMQISQIVAGYSLGAADILRRAMGKKDAKEMQRQKQIFIDGDAEKNIPGARKMGFDVKIAAEIFDLMEKFAEYGFNKSHSAAYAVIAYQTAYLRWKYPAQLFAASMSAEESKLEKIIPYIEDAKTLGIDVRPPDINRSGVAFECEDGTIWFGMKAIKNVGEGAAEAIVAERVKNGAYKSIYNLCERVDTKSANKKVLESLIYAGAFDSFGKKRSQLLQIVEQAMEQASRRQKMKEHGIQSIEDFLNFGDDNNEDSASEEEFYPECEELSDSELLKKEKSVLSIYFSSHPVMEAARIANGAFDNIEKVMTTEDGGRVRVLALVKSVRELTTKKSQEKMASFELEDLTSAVEAVIFPRSYKEFAPRLIPESVVVVEGTWKQRDGRWSINTDKIYTLDEALETLTEGMNISLSLEQIDENAIDQLYGIINRNPGKLPLSFTITNSDYALMIPASGKYGIRPNEDFFSQMRESYGSCRAYNNFEEFRKYIFEKHYTEATSIESELENAEPAEFDSEPAEFDNSEMETVYDS